MTISTKLMKASVVIAIFASFMLQGCIKDKCDLTYTHAKYTPVYMSLEDFHNAVSIEGPREIANPGKIYVKDDYLFVSEIAKGVHVIDNQNPSNPVSLAFINAPGNYDISFNCDKLYIDSSTDLLVFDMTNPAKPVFVERVQNALPHIVEYNGYFADASQGVVVEWIQEIVEEEYSCETGVPPLWVDNQIDPSTVNMLDGSTSRTINPATPGKGGSMSRFALTDDYLYIVTPKQLLVYDAANCTEHPSRITIHDLELWGGAAEMVFTMNDLLMIGSTSSMMIYSLSNPENPEFLSNFQHVNSCDPVTSDGTFAFVTLRNGPNDPCGGGWNNQLDVLNIENPRNPYLVSSFPMTEPAGLGLDGNMLFIADGPAGLRVFDASNPANVGNKSIAHFSEMQGFDVIPNDGVLIMVGEDGIVQYDYADPKNITKLSTIPVVN
ncbi:MAG: hypothetical protein R3B93_00530 [Bacteroidia bacterium]